MVKPKIFVSRLFPPPTDEILSEFCDVEVHPDENPPSKEKLLEGVKGKDGLLCSISDRIDREILEASPQLKVVSTYSVGYDHIDVSEATKRGIYVTYTPGVLTDATADATWALLMAAARRITEADKFIREGKWRIAWAPNMLVGEDVWGRTLGIIGLGRIGSAVARRAKGFNMKVLYYDAIRASQEKEMELGVEYRPLEELLREADYVTIHVPGGKETYHLIDEQRLRLMKPSSYLINTSRGSTVDQRALVKALREGWIAGAALDVYEKEPIDHDDPLLKLDNVVLAPHIGSGSKQARFKMGETAAKNLISVLKGEKPPFLVNEDVLEVRPLHAVKMI